MEAVLLNHMGTDLDVVNAARVSFAKRHNEFVPEKDGKLIRYLAKHNHWTPFGHAVAKFYVKAPIFVARQLVKHQVGLVWNEVSRRYIDDAPEFWWPEEWRLRAENVKQGSSFSTIKYSKEACEKFEKDACQLYQDMLNKGIAPEQARIVLPVNMYTEWHWTGSLAAWARVCKLRLDSHAQAETRKIALQISRQMHELFPVSWQALMVS